MMEIPEELTMIPDDNPKYAVRRMIPNTNAPQWSQKIQSWSQIMIMYVGDDHMILNHDPRWWFHVPRWWSPDDRKWWTQIVWF
jgi:hypothetical protein